MSDHHAYSDDQQHAGPAALLNLSRGQEQTALQRTAVPDPRLGPPSSAAPARSPRWEQIEQSHWPLVAVLTVQAALSLRLMWSNTAFGDEALYLWAGHVVWSHWLYGTPLQPHFPSNFSGAAVVYPPLGALADTYGGLIGARCLSMLLILTATVLLHGVTRRIFDRRAAWMAAALFAGLGPTQYLSALATYDAMALFMLALATWAGVCAAATRPAVGLPLLVLASATMVVADASKYVAALFNPVVVAVITAAYWRAHGRRVGSAAGSLLAALLAAGIAGGLAWGGHDYWVGIDGSTVTRAGTAKGPIVSILFVSAGWVGAVVALAVIGAVAATCCRAWPTRVMAWSLAGAGLLDPAEQAHIHLFTSLFKHVAYGGWFAAAVAGYALAAFMKAVPGVKQSGALRTCLVTIGLPGISGVLLAGNQYAVWPSFTPVLPTIQRAIAKNPGPVLAENYMLFAYYLAHREPWRNFTPVVLPNSSPYAAAIRARRYAVIALDFNGRGGVCRVTRSHRVDCGGTADSIIVHAINAYGGYKLVAKIPYKTAAFRSAYMIWVRKR